MTTTMYTATGRISYFDDGTISLLIDQELVDYYRSMIPKYIWTKSTKFPAHVTVVRGPVETWNYSRWGLDNGAIYTYNYFPQLTLKGKYCFLDVESHEIGLLREALGLSEFRKTFNNYHITIARIV